MRLYSQTSRGPRERPIRQEHQLLTEHETTIRVRYEDADPMGYLHHAKYLSYFEIARIELLRASGGNHRELEEGGLFAVVVRAECRYHAPARYDDLLTIKCTVTRVTSAKIQHEYQALREGELLATGFVTLALVDRDGNVQRVPESMHLK